MAHTVFWLASVYFTAFVGCAFSSPRWTAGEYQQNDIPETTTSENSSQSPDVLSDTMSVEDHEKSGNVKDIEQDKGGGETEILIKTKSGDKVQSETISMENETVVNEFPNATMENISTAAEKSDNDTEFMNSSEFGNKTDHVGCSNCMSKAQMKETLEERRIEFIKKQILQKLHMKTVPTFAGIKPNLPLKQLVNEYVFDEGILDTRTKQVDDYYAKTVQVFVMGNDVTRKCRAKRSAGCYYFQVDGKVSPEEVHTAELWIYKLFNRNDPYIQTFLISELGKGINNKRTPKRDVKRIETKLKYGWLKIPIKRTVLHWLQKPHKNYGLTVLCKFCQRQNHRTIFSSKDDSRPFLVINTRKHHPKRKIRSISTRCTEQSTECCLVPLEINFHSIGWDWIIAPSSFKANYCNGSCDAQYAAHNNHTVAIQDFRHNSARGRAMETEVKPCCSPISFRAQSILYEEENGAIKVAKIPNISATACGCM